MPGMGKRFGWSRMSRRIVLRSYSPNEPAAPVSLSIMKPIQFAFSANMSSLPVLMISSAFLSMSTIARAIWPRFSAHASSWNIWPRIHAS